MSFTARALQLQVDFLEKKLGYERDQFERNLRSATDISKRLDSEKSKKFVKWIGAVAIVLLVLMLLVGAGIYLNALYYLPRDSLTYILQGRAQIFALTALILPFLVAVTLLLIFLRFMVKISEVDKSDVQMFEREIFRFEIEQYLEKLSESDRATALKGLISSAGKARFSKASDQIEELDAAKEDAKAEVSLANLPIRILMQSIVEAFFKRK